MTRRLVLWLVIASTLAGCVAPAGVRTPAAAPHVHVTLLQINDAYVLEPVDGGRRGGMARLATLVKRARAANPNTIFAHAGDAISPSPMSTVLRGEQMIAALNALGVDVATFGNHEFDFGPEVLRRRMTESRFSWLSVNVVDRASGAPFGGAARQRIVTFGPPRLGLFGLTTPETATTSAAGPGVEFLEPTVAGRAAVAALRRAGAHVVVALTHQHCGRTGRSPPARTSTSCWAATSTGRSSPRRARPSSPRPARTHAISSRSICGCARTARSWSARGRSTRSAPACRRIPTWPR